MTKIKLWDSKLLKLNQSMFLLQLNNKNDMATRREGLFRNGFFGLLFAYFLICVSLSVGNINYIRITRWVEENSFYSNILHMIFYTLHTFTPRHHILLMNHFFKTITETMFIYIIIKNQHHNTQTWQRQHSKKN